MTLQTNPALVKGLGVRSTWLAESDGASYQAPSLDASPDEILMLRAREGDQDAFRILVTRHIDRIVGLARRVVGPAEAEDIAQDVFLKLWERKDQWRPGEGGFRPWLYRVALNRCIDQTRRRRNVPMDEAPEQVDSGQTPLEACDAKQSSARLRDAVSRLPERQRIAITLYYNEDMTAAEAAEVMGMRLNAVESLLKRGRRRLRELLG
jgi:RNA polymerase sigma-70 factor (ECF subfamily)